MDSEEIRRVVSQTGPALNVHRETPHRGPDVIAARTTQIIHRPRFDVHTIVSFCPVAFYSFLLEGSITLGNALWEAGAGGGGVGGR